MRTSPRCRFKQSSTSPSGKVDWLSSSNSFHTFNSPGGPCAPCPVFFIRSATAGSIASRFSSLFMRIPPKFNDDQLSSSLHHHHRLEHPGIRFVCSTAVARRTPRRQHSPCNGPESNHPPFVSFGPRLQRSDITARHGRPQLQTLSSCSPGLMGISCAARNYASSVPLCKTPEGRTDCTSDSQNRHPPPSYPRFILLSLASFSKRPGPSIHQPVGCLVSNSILDGCFDAQQFCICQWLTNREARFLQGVCLVTFH
ncbi:hypothetical protein BJ508DRAFT_133710 [Ascobolus immersus RN42]|uniref:Uncharacterized protein n=1 Tax=Ascobolus immersus RN42 TaxID=1160509 RepID=A0A3N4INX4_ASCIM|nr:hypothetical protein BJ508DRAFT_133710 [Ascobolus immersus RN42]